MSEYISRKSAKRIVDDIDTWSSGWRDYAKLQMDAIPAADVVPKDFHERCLEIEIQKRMALERKRGEWINQRADSEMCSACGVRFYISALFAVGGNNEPNYCPNCGALMDNEKDGDGE